MAKLVQRRSVSCVDRRAWTLIGALAMLWGASYMFIKVGLDGGLTPVGVVVARTTLAALVLIPIAARAGALRALHGGALGWIVVLALVQVVAPFLLITIGELHISTSLAAILVSISPIFTALLALGFDAAERSSGLRAIGVLLGIAGVGMLFGIDLTGGSDELLGGLAILVASLGYAVGPLTSKHRLAGIPPVAIVAATMTASALLLAPALAFTGVADRPPDAGTIAATLTLGLGGTGIAFLIFYTLIAEVGPARAALVSYIAPGFSIIYGALLLDEPIGVGTVVGLALILAGSYLGAGGRTPGRARLRDPGGEDRALLPSKEA
jgi:drug/metabolite transporter (DMT)-like permease